MSGLGQEDKWVLKEWTLAERFSANLVWFRRQAGLTQQELADRIGMNGVSLGVLERGKRLPRLDTILRLVTGLEVKNCDLVAWMWWDPAPTNTTSSRRTQTAVVKSSTPTSRRASGYRPSASRARSAQGPALQRLEEDRTVLELLRDDAPEVAPRSDRKLLGCCAPGKGSAQIAA